ncbi:MAG: helix-hairpin-helix domain-containing protein [Cryomorphaceae bacterium]|nr:helix-hairpin-helix domain-containing protein [Cryomorphaceae bacterium]
MWRKITDWFYMSPRERRGAAVLFLLLGLVIGMKLFLHTRDMAEGERWRAELLSQISLNEDIPANEKTSTENKSNSTTHISSSRSVVFSEAGKFDPNKVEKAKLQEMGLPDYAAKNWIRYLEKGGVFYKPEDVLYIYGMDTLWWASAKKHMYFSEPEKSEIPKIEIPSFDPNSLDSLSALKIGFSPWQFSQLKTYREKFGGITRTEDLLSVHGMDFYLYRQISPHVKISNLEKYIVDLNHADTTKLKRVRGIGSYYAREIVSMREVLGKIASFDQLLEIHGMDSLRWVSICSQVKLDTSGIQKISINHADVNALAALPYVNKSLAKEIVEFRENFQPFVSVDEIVQLSLFPKSKQRFILPYLTL